ncbi:MAG: ABC transporter permease [Erysipelotrichaceae bacterium]|nr:ABC transporter permease [Erysipelotrichaceae bacterium]
MLIKLALRNARKSFKDYSLYFVTLALGVCIFYLFNSIYAQQEIMVVTQTTNESMVMLQNVLGYISGFVAIILGFLIVYANSFFIKRRKKELGIYMILGMERNKISMILVLETCLLGLAALIVGLVFGVFGSQIMSIFTAKIFEADLSAYHFVFSMSAVIKSTLNFGLIFLVVMIFNVYTVNKCQLIELLYANRKNEKNTFISLKVSKWLFLIAILMIAAAYYLILWNGMNVNIWFSLCLLLGSIGTILFYYALAGILVVISKKNKKFYFKDLNMFVLRQLSHKINTNYISIAIVCLTLLLVIGIFSSGYSVQNAVSQDLNDNIPYDISLYKYIFDEGDEYSILARLDDDFKNDPAIAAIAESKIYVTDLSLADLGIKDPSSFNVDNYVINFIPLSQYNQNMALIDQQPLVLGKDEYAIGMSKRGMADLFDPLLEEKVSLKLNGQQLYPAFKTDVPLSNNEYLATIIVNDEIIANDPSFKLDQVVVNIECIDDDAAKMLESTLEDYYHNHEVPFSFFFTKAQMYAQSISTKAIVSFLGIYLGLVFMIVSASILAIQQLSQTTDNYERYLLLQKLGAEPKMINKALFIQVLCYFLFPLSLAMIHAFVGLQAANKIIALFGKIDVTASLFATASFIVLIYGCYFVLTYLGCKNVIKEQ